MSNDRQTSGIFWVIFVCMWVKGGGALTIFEPCEPVFGILLQFMDKLKNIKIVHVTCT